MKLTSVVLLALTAIVVVPRAARAQNEPRVGLTMGYPSSVGVIWHMTNRVAVRPEITFARTTGDSIGNDLPGASPISTSDSTGVGTGISALFYVHRWDALRTYISPRF